MRYERSQDHEADVMERLYEIEPNCWWSLGGIRRFRPNCERRDMRKVAVVAAALALVMLAGCSSSRVLNESRARSLLQAAASKTSYTVPVRSIQPLMSRTQADYAAGAGSTEGAQAMKRLLDKGMITASVQSLSYPKISGLFRGQVHNMFCDNKDLQATVTLENVPNSNSVLGEEAETNCDGMVGKSSIKGTVNEAGDLNLTVGDTFFLTQGKYQEHEGKADLTLIARTTTEFHGNASGQKVEAKWYQYSFSPETSKQLVNSDAGPALPAGEIEIGEVSGLRLMNETRAQCSFAWSSNLNAAGAAVRGLSKQTGAGWAMYTKKPDESWALDGWGLGQ